MRIPFLASSLALLPIAAGEEIGWHASGRGGAIAAEDSRAVSAGLKMLERGGNATDAAVAAMLVASVADFGMFCIGAEVPFMIYDARRQEVKTLSGLGAAPLDEEESLPMR